MSSEKMAHQWVTDGIFGASACRVCGHGRFAGISDSMYCGGTAQERNVATEEDLQAGTANRNEEPINYEAMARDSERLTKLIERFNYSEDETISDLFDSAHEIAANSNEDIEDYQRWVRAAIDKEMNREP